MTAKKFKLIFLLLFVLLTIEVSAFTIRTEPDELVFADVLNNGYAEKKIKIFSDSLEQVQLSFSATEPIKRWVEFSPAAASISKDSPVELKVILKPSDAPLGIYQGYIVINTLSGGNEITTSLVTSITIETTVEITDQEIVQAVVQDVMIKDIEINSPIKALVTVQNKGNVALSPFCQMDILNSDKTQILKSAVSEKKAILPSSTDVIELNVPNNLPLGTYWAEITTSLEDGIVGKRMIKFEIVEKGAVPAEEEPAVFKEEPITLGVSWIVILMWVLVLAFVVWTIAKHKPKKK